MQDKQVITAAEQAAWHAGLDEGRAQAAPAAVAVPDERWCPDVCPITGRRFFGWIEHWKTGQDVPTYGGPFDSYTIPVKDEDGTFSCERFDHDAGEWMTEGMGWCCLGLMLADDQAFVVQPGNPRYDEIRDFAEGRAALAATPAADAPENVKRAKLAAELRLLARVQDEKYPNFRIILSEAALALEGVMLAPAAAPVVLPEPVAWIADYVDREGNSKFYTSTHKDLAVENDMNGNPQPLYTEQQVRALLAGVSAPAAQAVEATMAFEPRPTDDAFLAWWEPYELSDHWFVELHKIARDAWNAALSSPQAQADAREAQLLAFAVSEIRRDEMTDSELLDAMEQKRIAVVPEYEGPWDAEIYNDEGKPNHYGSGSTPREAIRAAIAAQAAQQGGAA